MTDPETGPAGTLAEEALRLIETLGVIAGAHQATSGVGSGVGSVPECRVCPLCRLIAGVQQLRPEVIAHLVAAGEELLAAAREFAASSAPSAAGGPGDPGRDPASRPAGDGPLASGANARVPERIELD